MSLFRKSIVLKLWLVMVTLVLIVLYFTGNRADRQVKRIVLQPAEGAEAHDGSIEILSLPGAGSTFAFTLPISADIKEGYQRD